MPDQSDETSKDASPRESNAQRGDETESERKQAGAGNSGGERSTESRPRGKTEDPDKTL